MKQNKFLLSIVLVFSFLFTACNKEKIAEQERIIGQLNSHISQLQMEIENLKTEIEKLKETDQFYYQSGADEFSSGNYEQAIEWMNKLKNRFPSSSLLASANKLINDSNANIVAIYQAEKQKLNQLVRAVAGLEIEESIAKLNAYVTENHPLDLIQTATQSLNKYKEEYEKVRAERELEQSLGVRLVDYSTGWGLIDDLASTMFVPQLKLIFKNITGYSLRGIEVRTDFIKTTGDEVWDDESDYLVYEYSGSALDRGFSKTLFVNAGVGYRNEIPFSSVPSLYANIYVNNKFYKKIPIAKKYRQ